MILRDLLEPIYRQPFSVWILATLLAANVAVFTRARFEQALLRQGTDYAALVFYQWSGFWLAGWLFVVTVTLPDQLPATLIWVVAAMVIAGSLVVRIQGRI